MLRKTREKVAEKFVSLISDDFYLCVALFIVDPDDCKISDLHAAISYVSYIYSDQNLIIRLLL